MKILTIKNNISYLPQVIALGDKNRNILGFLPKSAFEEHASKDEIIISVNQSENKLTGYLLYRKSFKKNIVSIVHLCIDNKERKKGIASNLVNYFKKITKDKFSGIKIKTRRDYVINKIWPKFGFYAASEIKGKSINGSIITIWKIDFKYPDLFQYLYDKKAESKLRVAIDANIFFDLQYSPTKDNEQSHLMLSNWIDEKVEFCLTQLGQNLL